MSTFLLPYDGDFVEYGVNDPVGCYTIRTICHISPYVYEDLYDAADTLDSRMYVRDIGSKLALFDEEEDPIEPDVKIFVQDELKLF